MAGFSELGVDVSQVLGSDAGDASVFVVIDRGRSVVACVVGDLVQGGSLHKGALVGQGLDFCSRVGTAGGSSQHLRVDGAQVVGGDAGDACGLVVGHGQCGWGGAVAVVVRLDFGQGGIGCSHQGLRFGHAVGTARGLLEHLGVDSGQVVGGDAGDTRGLVVGHGQGSWVCAVAVVIGLDLGQRCVGRCDPGLDFCSSVGTAGGSGQHLRVDCGQVVGGDAGDTRGLVVGHGQGGWVCAIAVVVGLDLGQRCVGRCDPGLDFCSSVGTTGGSSQHLRVDGSQVVCGDAFDAGGHVVGHGERCGRGAIAVVVGLNFGQGVGR